MAPLKLGALDFCIGLTLMVMLAIALIGVLQGVDSMVIAFGADRALIGVDGRLKALGRAPTEPENWWIYLTLFSTLLPSALNLVIGVVSLTTLSTPTSRQWLVQRLKRLQDKGDGMMRAEIFLRLAAPVFLGTLVAVLVGFGFVWVLVGVGASGLRQFLCLAKTIESLLGG